MSVKQLTPTFLHRAVALLKQPADVLTAMRKYQSYYRNYSARWDYYICEDMGCAAVLTTKLQPGEHAATIRDKHDPSIHWPEETMMSSHHDAVVRCYHLPQTQLATTQPLRLPVWHRLQRDCQTSRRIRKRYPEFLLDSHGRNTHILEHACWQQLQRKSARSVHQVWPLHFARTLM